ncbi:ABC transporter permease [Devosia sp. RR2S18]|jgi:osmoprotectant transport system permease protein|uniref:ABC transporter permease n=1 Tax=Devosia rhizosphaerae TaxID=3049774 RepID=UPI0025406324|nr:ABC transporter permease [Devosia sp. RR2S18]WIJ24418.1 ABC transporter permease [Devosia sp. RR2S18]HEV7291438.1 ABC transporter permease [Devosia sp.]
MKIGLILRLVALVVLLAFLVSPQSFSAFFALFAGPRQPAIYEQGAILDLTLNHLAIVAAATFAATLVAVGLAIIVTRPFGAEFLPLSRSLANIGQTFPPVAVLALAVPVLGFGTAPTLVALFLYGLLPIFENSLAGLLNLPKKVTEAARGMGMSGWQRLVSVELPLALPVILAGIRLSTVISLGTATIGSTVAARTLGEVIIAGLLTGNTAFVLQGGMVVGILAVLIYDGMAALERWLMARTGQAVRAAA